MVFMKIPLRMSFEQHVVTGFFMDVNKQSKYHFSFLDYVIGTGNV